MRLWCKTCTTLSLTFHASGLNLSMQLWEAYSYRKCLSMSQCATVQTR